MYWKRNFSNYNNDITNSNSISIDSSKSNKKCKNAMVQKMISIEISIKNIIIKKSNYIITRESITFILMMHLILLVIIINCDKIKNNFKKKERK